ncbi:MAG: cytochrome c oxidase subunit II [Actinomycetota bacterium]
MANRKPGFSRKFTRRAVKGALLSLLVLAATACAGAEDAPQSVLNPAGEFSRAPDVLWNITLAIAVVVFVLVEGALVYALIRFRHKEGRKASQFHGNTKVEVVLTVVPALILAGLAIPTVGTILDLQGDPPEDGLRVEVIAHQFWWEFNYPEENITTANELHIPAGEPVVLEIQGAETDGVDGTAEVIHSFWIPRLGGTQDVVPGYTNFLRYQADEPGRFLGQCKEFCGLSHANMKLVAYAHTQEDFDAWVEQQTSPAAESASGDAAAGREIFAENFEVKSTVVEDGADAYACASCHAVQPGLEAQPKIGPNLTHFAGRSTFAGATFENNAENLAAWLRDPDGVRPGSKMPALDLSEDQINDLVAYLQSLE